MTTEVLRNMIYARSGQLDRLGYAAAYVEPVAAAG